MEIVRKCSKYKHLDSNSAAHFVHLPFGNSWIWVCMCCGWAVAAISYCKASFHRMLLRTKLNYKWSLSDGMRTFLCLYFRRTLSSSLFSSLSSSCARPPANKHIRESAKKCAVVLSLSIVWMRKLFAISRHDFSSVTTEHDVFNSFYNLRLQHSTIR